MLRRARRGVAVEYPGSDMKIEGVQPYYRPTRRSRRKSCFLCGEDFVTQRVEWRALRTISEALAQISRNNSDTELVIFNEIRDGIFRTHAI